MSRTTRARGAFYLGIIAGMAGAATTAALIAAPGGFSAAAFAVAIVAPLLAVASWLVVRRKVLSLFVPLFTVLVGGIVLLKNLDSSDSLIWAALLWTLAFPWIAYRLARTVEELRPTGFLDEFRWRMVVRKAVRRHGYRATDDLRELERTAGAFRLIVRRTKKAFEVVVSSEEAELPAASSISQRLETELPGRLLLCNHETITWEADELPMTAAQVNAIASKLRSFSRGGAGEVTRAPVHEG